MTNEKMTNDKDRFTMTELAALGTICCRVA